MSKESLALDCSRVVRRFGSVTALDGADLAVPAGTLTAVLGPSGCGKSTLLRVIAGFERPDAGTVTVGGRVVAGPGVYLPPERRGIGMVPQEQALFPHLSVAANVGYGLVRSGRSGRRRAVAAERRERVEVMLELAGLAGTGDRMPFELSGGQQQRVALARALAPVPAVVLLDEPFANLDAALRVSLRAEVREILRAAGTTAVIVTHDQEEALSMADMVAVMRGGRVVQAATPDVVYRRPVDAWVAGFVGDANVLPGRVTGEGAVSCALGDLACGWPGRSNGAGGSTGAAPVQVVVRPEQLRLVSAAGGSPGAAAVVDSRQYFGHDCLVRLVLEDGTALVARTTTTDATEVGAPVTVSCEGDVVCFPQPA